MKQLTLFSCLCLAITAFIWFMLSHLHWSGRGLGSETVALQNACSFRGSVISCNITETKHKVPLSLASLQSSLVFKL